MEGFVCSIVPSIEIGAVGEGEARSVGGLQAKIASDMIKMTGHGLRGSTYFIADKEFQLFISHDIASPEYKTA